MPPTEGNGKICYLELPATDIARSAEFYKAVFGWQVRTRGDGHLAFDDGVGEVSGTWVTGRPPASEANLLIYIMVDDIAATCDALRTHGGSVIKPADPSAREVIATFRDPGGNVLGIYEHRMAEAP